MSYSRLSLNRYQLENKNKTTSIRYFSKVSDLFSEQDALLINPEESLENLITDLKNLFELTQSPENKLHDVVLEVESAKSYTNKVFAHRQILIARSSFFEKRVFEDGNNEENEKYFTVTEDADTTIVTFKKEFCSDINLLREVIAYMYWCHWETNLDNAHAVFELASTFDLKELRNRTGALLAANLNRDNVIDVLMSADELDVERLRKDCMEYIIRNRNDDLLEELEDKLMEYVEEKQKKGHSDPNYLVARLYREGVFIKNRKN